MKRVMNLIGTIIGTVFDAIYTVIMLLGVTLILQALGMVNESVEGAEGLSAIVGILMLLVVIFGVVALALNAACIGAYSWKHEKYVKKRGVLIAAIVFNVLLGLLVILSSTEVFAILVFIASLAAATLIIVDMCLEGKRVAKMQAAEAPAAEAAPAEQPAEPAEKQ